MIDPIKIIWGTVFEFNESIAGWIGVLFQLITIGLLIFGFIQWRYEVREKQKFDDLLELHKKLVQGYYALREFHQMISIKINSRVADYTLFEDEGAGNDGFQRENRKIRDDLFDKYQQNIGGLFNEIRSSVNTLDHIYDIGDLKDHCNTFIMKGFSRKKFINDVYEEMNDEAENIDGILTTEQFLEGEEDDFLESVNNDFDKVIQELKRSSTIFD